MDELDTALLALLAEDARAPVATLARRLGLARTTVQARLDRLETTGVIAGYTLRLGARARPRLRATVLITIEPRAGPRVIARLKALPAVRAVHSVSGRFDLIVEVTTDHTEALDAALDDLGATEGVKSSESLIHLATKLDRNT